MYLQVVAHPIFQCGLSAGQNRFELVSDLVQRFEFLIDGLLLLGERARELPQHGILLGLDGPFVSFLNLEHPSERVFACPVRILQAGTDGVRGGAARLLQDAGFDGAVAGDQLADRLLCLPLRFACFVEALLAGYREGQRILADVQHLPASHLIGERVVQRLALCVERDVAGGYGLGCSRGRIRNGGDRTRGVPDQVRRGGRCRRL